MSFPARPPGRADYDPFHAPKWVQPYLDCVHGIVAVGLGDRMCRVEMYRGTCIEDAVMVGLVEVYVPEGAEHENVNQKRRTT